MKFLVANHDIEFVPPRNGHELQVTDA